MVNLKVFRFSGNRGKDYEVVNEITKEVIPGINVRTHSSAIAPYIFSLFVHSPSLQFVSMCSITVLSFSFGF